MEDLMEKAKDFVALAKQKKDLEASLNDVKKKLGEIEPILLEAIEQDKFPSSSRVDGMTVFLRKETWASAKDGDYDRACAALRNCGLHEYVQTKFNTQSISAYVRDLEREGVPLDPRLEEVLKITDTYKVQARAA